MNMMCLKLLNEYIILVYIRGKTIRKKKKKKKEVTVPSLRITSTNPRTKTDHPARGLVLI